jgi:hypothetical protein
MSAPILNSNANSALISTLSSSDALVNPFEYSLEKMLPFGAKYTTEVQPVQGAGQTFSANSVIDFDLPKWGMLNNICMNFGVINGASTATNISQIGILALIDNIELLSSSRRILNLTYKDIMCLISDYPLSQRAAINSYLNETAPNQTAATYNSFDSPHYSLQIPFALFFNHKINPNLLFQEPLRVRIHLSDCKISGTAGAGNTATVRVAHSVYDPMLSCEYFNPPRELEDKTIQENYGDGSLSVVCYDFHDETEVVSQTPYFRNTDYDLGNYLECEIKDVGVVSDIYFMVSLDQENIVSGDKGTAAASEENTITGVLHQRHRCAEPIVRCELTANGQVIYAKTYEEMRVYGRKSDGKDPYTMGAELSATSTFNNVFKIPLCLSDDKRYPCGGVSMRELHNVRLRVWLKGDTGATGSTSNLPSVLPADNVLETGETSKNSIKPSLKVMLKKYQILTTESASGRVITSVAN